jgi:hypothetical protein
MRIPWLWRLASHARDQQQHAETEVARSQAALAETEQRLAHPLLRANQRNHYSDIIRDALQLGYDKTEGNGRKL